MIKSILAIATVGAVAVSTLVSGTAHAAHAPKSSTETIMLGSKNGSHVTGTAKFTYNSATKTTTVLLHVSGLKPMTVHPAHIHLGASCSANGAVLYTFHPVSGMGMMTEANGSGVMNAKTSFTGSYTAKPLYINVHTGPGLVPASQFKVMACGVVGMSM